MKGNLKTSSIAVKSFMAVGILALALTGCMKKELYEPDSGKDDGEDNGKVTLDNYFDFSTTQTVQLNVNYGEDYPKAYFEVYAENPLIFQEEGSQVSKREDLIAIAGGFTNGAGIYDKKAVIPAFVSEVYIYSPDFGVPTLYKTEVSNGVINANITFENELDLSTMSARSVGNRAAPTEFITKVVPNTLGTWNATNGKPDYLNGNKINIDGVLKSYITTYFPEKKNNSSSPYVSDDSDIEIKEAEGITGAHISLNYFGGDTEARSVFGYYCYPKGASIDQIREAVKHACVIFPNAYKGPLGDYSGVGVDLKYIDPDGKLHDAEEGFPVGTKIGFLIWNDAWKYESVAKAKHIFYSTKSLNSTGRSHTAIFRAKNKNGDSYNVISMEDWNNVGGGEPDYNDVAFIISSDPIEAIDVPVAPDPDERKGTDKYQGLLGFEDNWPEQGDYDMNDVVVKYASNIDYNSDNKIINITDKITLAWTGADYRNGFSYEVPFDLSQAHVTITGGENSSISNNVINVFTDAKKELGVSGIPAGEMPSQNVTEKNFVVTMKFDKPIIDKESITPPYNPFIKLGNVEVHLTDQKPSSAATNQFPNGADISDGETTFFVCEDGFPFAIHMDARADQSMLNVNLKQEGVRIDKTYPGFVDWAKTRDPKTKWWK
ncbi:LruC domain-containing protein [Phocaeicola sp.]